MADVQTSVAPRYTVIIQWDEESDCYVVSLPEWGPLCKAYGNSYEEAAKHAREVLELLMEGESALPVPQPFHYPGAAAVNLPDAPVATSPPAPLPAKRTA